MADAVDDDWRDDPKVADPFDQATVTDAHLAGADFPILVEVARTSEYIAYSELVSRAKVKHPDNPIVQNAIPVSTGRWLEVVDTKQEIRLRERVKLRVGDRPDG